LAGGLGQSKGMLNRALPFSPLSFAEEAELIKVDQHRLIQEFRSVKNLAQLGKKFSLAIAGQKKSDWEKRENKTLQPMQRFFQILYEKSDMVCGSQQSGRRGRAADHTL
jgi:hypothetical protein